MDEIKDEIKGVLDTFVERHAQRLWSQGTKLDVDKGLNFGNNVGYITSFSIERRGVAPNDEERVFGVRVIVSAIDIIDCNFTMKNALVVRFYAKRMCWYGNLWDACGATQAYEAKWSAFPEPLNDNPHDLL